MDKILAKAQELKSSLNETPEFKEYFRLKALYDNNEEIKSLLIQLSKTQKGSKEYQELFKQYNEHPLVNNLIKAREDVVNLINTIKDIIEP